MRHLIIGNGPAGVVAAETLRKRAPEDEIMMLGAENYATVPSISTASR